MQYIFLSKIQNHITEKTEKKFYYFMAKFQGSGFSFQSLNQNIKVVIHYRPATNNQRPFDIWTEHFIHTQINNSYKICGAKIIQYTISLKL